MKISDKTKALVDWIRRARCPHGAAKVQFCKPCLEERIQQEFDSDRATIRALVQMVIAAKPHDCQAVDDAWDAIHEWMQS